jgi:Transcriptional regulator
MNSRHFQIFLKVCETGSMTRAAKELFMTQPSVSQVISELEREYAVRLFERLNHHLYLTEAGRQLRTYASQILNLSEQARLQLAELGSAGSLRVGASHTVGTYLLPDIFSEYRIANTNVEIFSVVDNTQAVENLLLEDKVDLGIVEGMIHSKDLLSTFLCRDDLVIICGRQHPLWSAPEVALSALENQPFIIREAGSGTRELLEREMNAASVNWKLAGIYSSTEAIKKAVEQNLALAAVPKTAVTDEIKQGKLKEVCIQGFSLQRNFNLVHHKQKFFTPAIQSFILASQTVVKNTRS